jgi:predicted nucleic acid-binding protein
MNTLLAAFFEEALDEFHILPLEESFLEFSFDLVLDDNLRTLDSLQLSAAISLTETSEPIRFVCADERLLEIAEQYGLKTTNPTE